MRIAQVCPYSLTFPGGVQAQVLGLARALRDGGEQVRVIAPLDGEPPEPFVVGIGRSVRVRANGSVAPVAPHPAAACRTIAALRSGRFDVVHLHEPLAPGPPLAALVGARIPIVGTFHRAGAGFGYRAWMRATSPAARRLAARCAVSQQALETVEGLGGPFELLFNGIERELFAGAKPSPKTGPTIVFVGRHEPRKGLQVLLAAMESLPQEARLWVLGHGPQTKELRARSGRLDGVEWVGRVGEREKAELIKGADVLCAPSLGGESFGVVVLEAMAAGTAVVASDIPGYRALASGGAGPRAGARVGEEGSQGLDGAAAASSPGAGEDSAAVLVPPGDAGALAQALSSVLYDGALRARLVRAGDVVARGRSMQALAARYTEVYASAVGAR